MSESKKKLFRKVLKYQIHDINTNTTYQESTYVDLSKILNISEESVSKIVNGNLNVRKYIHRYARPEVESNPEIHYSFRSDWTILKSSGSESGM
jgi:energy-converting hydrogenase A subunit M